MKKILAVLLVSLLILSGCGSNKDSGDKAEYVDTYSYVYTTDIDTLNYIVTDKATNGDHFANFLDGLMENNSEGKLVPAMATADPEVGTDENGFTTYTYKIREGVKWVTNEGEEFAEVKPSDWVTGLKYAADAPSANTFIVADSVVGFAEYQENPSIGFDSVGVKADDEAMTLTYTLKQPEPYWNSKTTYGILMPLNAEFLASKGDQFGTTEASSILYNGPYILSENTAKSKISYKANDAYWDKDNVFTKNIDLFFFTGEDMESLYRGFSDGTYSTARVYPALAGYKDVLAADADNIVTTPLNASTYGFKFNVNRQSYTYTSKTTDKEKDDARLALQNKKFRQAIVYAVDRAGWNAQNAGEDYKTFALRNTLTIPTLVSANGKSYGELVAKYMEEINTDLYKGIDLADGVEAYHNAEKSASLLAEAKAELEAEGVTFPVRLDMLADKASDLALNRARSVKESVETALGTDSVVIDIQAITNDEVSAASFYGETAAEYDYDLSAATGWGPDYTDPSANLDVFDVNQGQLLLYLGIDPLNTSDDANNAAVAEKVGLVEYTAILDEAKTITNDLDARYDALAKAEAFLNDQALQVYLVSLGGTPGVTKVAPFTRSFAYTGLGDARFKYMKVQKDTVTTEQYDAARKEWEAKMAD